MERHNVVVTSRQIGQGHADDAAVVLDEVLAEHDEVVHRVGGIPAVAPVDAASVVAGGVRVVDGQEEREVGIRAVSSGRRRHLDRSTGPFLAVSAWRTMSPGNQKIDRNSCYFFPLRQPLRLE